MLPNNDSPHTSIESIDKVCTVDDDYVRDQMRWVVVLANGQIVYQDDNRPGLAEPSAWKRLRAYCDKENTYIVEMWLQFRSNRILIEPRDADGYFFVKAAYGIWGQTDTMHAYIVGTLVTDRLAKDGVVHATKWKIPELVFLEHQSRIVNLDSPMLILRKS